MKRFLIIAILILSSTTLLQTQGVKEGVPMTAFEGLRLARQYASFVKQRKGAVLCYTFSETGYTYIARDGSSKVATTSWDYVFCDGQDYFTAKCLRLYQNNPNPIVLPSDVEFKPSKKKMQELVGLLIDSDKALDILDKKVGNIGNKFSYIALEMEVVDNVVTPLWKITLLGGFWGVTAKTGKIATPIDKEASSWKTLK